MDKKTRSGRVRKPLRGTSISSRPSARATTFPRVSLRRLSRQREVAMVTRLTAGARADQYWFGTPRLQQDVEHGNLEGNHLSQKGRTDDDTPLRARTQERARFLQRHHAEPQRTAAYGSTRGAGVRHRVRPLDRRYDRWLRAHPARG